jgi:pyruvate dehydrogenase E2 component (dihydrolipoamide acetyltransferase)
MAEFRMPSLGADMDQGTVIEWLVKPGDPVHHGDVVAVVDTAKAAVEVECFDTGVVERLLVAEGTAVPVGTPLAIIAEKAPAAAPTKPPGPAVVERPTTEPLAAAALHISVAEHPSVEPAASGAPASPPAAPVAAETPAPPPTSPPLSRPATRSAVTPIIRKLATESGIELSTVHGTGRNGAITRHDLELVREHRAARPAVTPYARRLAGELGVDLAVLGPGPIRAADVRAAVPVRQATKPAATSTATSTSRAAGSMRGAIAELMTRANRDIPHYHLATTVDLGAAMAWLHDHNRAVPLAERLVPAALLLKATALAAAEAGALNGHWLDGEFHPSSTVDLGVATSLRGGGLLVPVLPDAAALPVTELMYQLRDRVARARAGRPRASDLAQASITVTNLGDLGVELVHGVIHPPQVALVGFGAVVERPWAAGGMVGVRPVVTVTLAADHRATDGAIGAHFLHAVNQKLQRPEEL